MTGEEIKDKMTENFSLIEQLSDPTTFVLNTAIAKLMEDNRQLAKMCPHKFENGFCIYCSTKEN